MIFFLKKKQSCFVMTSYQSLIAKKIKHLHKLFLKKKKGETEFCYVNTS